jgi:hypothetical protein
VTEFVSYAANGKASFLSYDQILYRTTQKFEFRVNGALPGFAERNSRNDEEAGEGRQRQEGRAVRQEAEQPLLNGLSEAGPTDLHDGCVRRLRHLGKGHFLTQLTAATVQKVAIATFPFLLISLSHIFGQLFR